MGGLGASLCTLRVSCDDCTSCRRQHPTICQLYVSCRRLAAAGASAINKPPDVNHRMDAQDSSDTEAFKRLYHQVANIELDECRKQIFREVRSHLRSRDLDFRPKKWQIAAATEICQGGDCFAITRTGSGKSLVYQMIPMVKPRGYVLVICPLLALM